MEEAERKVGREEEGGREVEEGEEEEREGEERKNQLPPIPQNITAYKVYFD